MCLLLGILAPGESSTIKVQIFVSTEMAMNQLTSDQLKVSMVIVIVDCGVDTHTQTHTHT
ncbi:hypothetical protein EON63_14020 [archaeon]|nr:MAG: hypothetical protein EON63_14020 [archaeon]